MITFGVDISKLKFDIFYQDQYGKKISKTFDNKLSGFEELLKITPEKARFVMEATGNYCYDLANFLHQNDHMVFVVNPAQIKYFGQSKLRRIKTDKADAKLIYEFACVNDNLCEWRPMAAHLQQFRALQRCLQSLKLDLVQFKNRLESERDGAVIEIFKSVIETIESKIDEVILQIRSLVQSDDKLNRMVSLLITIPGIGEVSAWVILSEVDISNFKNAKQLTAYAGLNPHIQKSGTSVMGRGSISKIGCKQLRKALYFPAMVALRFNPIIKQFGERLKANGKVPKVVTIAAMRKLLRIIFAVLQKDKPFDAETACPQAS